MNNEFYIGYADQMPVETARVVRRGVMGAIVMSLLVFGLIAATHTPAESGTYEFGIEKPFEGLLMESPLPLLQVGDSPGSITNYILVGSGKFGLPSYARGHNGQRVRFVGSLIYKGTALMVELNDEKSFQVVSSGSVGPVVEETRQPSTTGKSTPNVWVGELVDTKCYLGVMRPGAGKVHRGCAVRCLSGGVPPGLLLRDSTGNSVVMMLVGVGGKPLEFDVQWAARFVRAEGHLSLRGSLPILEVSRLQLADDFPTAHGDRK